MSADPATGVASAKRARFLEIGPYPPPFGGWSQRIAWLRHAIEEQGHVCTVLNIGAGRRIASPDYECVRSGFEYVVKLVRFARRGHLFHLHVNGSSPKGILIAAVAAVVAVGFRCRPVLTFHAGEEQPYFPRYRSVVMTPVLQFLFRVSSHVICNNDGVRRHIAAYGVGPEKILPIPAFSRQYLAEEGCELDGDLARFVSTHTPTMVAYTDLGGAPSVLEVLARASKQWPDLGAIVTTTEPSEVLRQARAMSVPGSNLLVVGPRTHREFLALLASSSVYLRCRSWDGTSASICEALAQGTPVVANETGSRPAGVRTYRHGDTEAMLAALAAVLSDPAAARREVLPPPPEDTLQQEVAVLLGAWEERRCDPGATNPGIVSTREP